MASRIIHLAVAELLIRQTEIADADRFRLGCILPDAGMQNKAAHFKVTLTDGERMYALSAFRREFGDRFSDALYLGYYAHLIQDMLFRNFIYADNSYDFTIPANVDRLHLDYSLCNRYVIEKYALPAPPAVPADFASEPINRITPFAAEEFITDMAQDYRLRPEGRCVFFTEEQADDFIAQAAALCIKEINALRTGKPLIDDTAYAYGRK